MTQILTFGTCQEGGWAGSESPQALGPGFTTQGPHIQSSTKFPAEERSINQALGRRHGDEGVQGLHGRQGAPGSSTAQRGLLSP